MSTDTQIFAQALINKLETELQQGDYPGQTLSALDVVLKCVQSALDAINTIQGAPHP